jgi:drug/metabolite transporter (DMT)-like permease
MSQTAVLLLALVSAFGVGLGFVLTQFALRWMPPWQGAAFSVPTTTLLFWCLAPFFVDLAGADGTAVGLFAVAGIFFPATVTLLNFESNRLVGPNIAGAVSGLTPLFAVLLAILMLGESPRPLQLLAIAAVVAGVMLMYVGRRQILSCWSIWMLVLPLLAAVIRGCVQPVVKVGLQRWPNPIVAVLIGYTVSSAVLIGSALTRDPTYIRRSDPRGALWFGGIGVCHGLAVLSLYVALGHGPLALVSPLAACYPLVTLVLSFAFLKHEPITPQLVTAVVLIVSGVILLIAT